MTYIRQKHVHSDTITINAYGKWQTTLWLIWFNKSRTGSWLSGIDFILTYSATKLPLKTAISRSSNCGSFTATEHTSSLFSRTALPLITIRTKATGMVEGLLEWWKPKESMMQQVRRKDIFSLLLRKYVWFQIPRRISSYLPKRILQPNNARLNHTRNDSQVNLPKNRILMTTSPTFSRNSTSNLIFNIGI